tara:strand:- start:617 stop:1294 length:678 start_codon:yes stop_codon:yes gene_type:complete
MSGSSVLANEIYIDQIGDNLDLDITQDGQDNKVGTSQTDMTLAGDDMTFAITQTGNFNEIVATIKGTDYTGTWQFTGNTNTVDLQCSSTSTGDCDTVTLNITTTGSDNTFDFDIGENEDADSATVSFTVTGDNNIINSDIDGTSAVLTVVMNNANSLATTSANSDEGNKLDIDMDGNGDSAGHTVILDITGGGSTYDIDQSGVNDATVNATFDGDSQDVDITQSD